MKIALFPGSFDPVTNGHINVIKRALGIFDSLIVAVAVNMNKDSLFSVDERKIFLTKACEDLNFKGITISHFNGLLVDAVKKFNASVVIRGLRAVSDFEIEFQMALMNRELNDKCETMFLMPSPQYSFVSSRMIREIAKFGGDISTFVPLSVVNALKQKSGKNK